MIEVIEVARKASLGLYLEDEEIKKRIKIASAKRGVSATAYCAEAIEEFLRRDGEIGDMPIDKRLFCYHAWISSERKSGLLVQLPMTL